MLRLNLKAAESQGIVACYDVTEDWNPVYDKSSLPGYFMAVGTSGNQFKNAGVVGKTRSSGTGAKHSVRSGSTSTRADSEPRR